MTGSSPRSPLFGPEGLNREILMEAMALEGASVVGRRTYDVPQGLGRQAAGQWAVLCVDPQSSQDDVSSAFTFVTDGIESAVRQAVAARKSGHVDLMGANVIQRGFRASLVARSFRR